MLRATTLRFPPKPNAGKVLWDTLQKKGMKEAAVFAKGYAKGFSKSQEGQDLYKKMAKTTAAAEARVKGTFNHYWNAFHEVKSNIKTGPAEGASSSDSNSSSNNNNNNNNNGNNSGGSSSNAGRRSFFQRMSDFWTNNKEYLASFLAANFMAVVFAFQYGSQVWGLCSGLWNVYWANAAAKAKKLAEDMRREAARRLALEESEDALDDVYGGSSSTEHTMSHGGTADPANHGINNAQPNRAASATNSALDEEALQRRLARREERRRKKELEESGLVMHDDHYARREEERQSSLFTGAPSARKLEKEEVRQMSGMEMLATALLKREEDEEIDGSLASTDMANAEQRDRAAMEAYWRKQQQMRGAKKQLTRKMRRKIRKMQKEQELKAFFAQREAEQSAAGRNGLGSSSSSSASPASSSNHAADVASNALAFTDSFSYKVGDSDKPVSFAAQHDRTHSRFAGLRSSYSEEGGGLFSRLWGTVVEKQQAVFDFTAGVPDSPPSGRGATKAANASNVHDFTNATA